MKDKKMDKEILKGSFLQKISSLQPSSARLKRFTSAWRQATRLVFQLWIVFVAVVIAAARVAALINLIKIKRSNSKSPEVKS